MAGSIIFLKNDKDVGSGFSVIVDDDGRVCYAYLQSPDGEIVGDVWLYNRCEAPLEPEWTEKTGAPYANPRGYLQSPPNFKIPDRETDIAIRWSKNDQGNKFVDILTSDLVIGRVQAGHKPGWALAAGKDGPLAKVLEVEGEMELDITLK